MLSNRPYLLRAFYQWIVDSNCNPILVIDANNPRCKIPRDFVEGTEIVFNISPTAIRDLKMQNDVIEFKASFSSVIHIISAPVKAVLAVYAEENGEGIFFDAEEDDSDADDAVQMNGIDNLMASEKFEQGIDVTQAAKGKNKPFLTLVE